MAEAVVSGVVTRIGDLLVQEGKFLSGVRNQVELLQIELKLMQGLLKDADYTLHSKLQPLLHFAP